MREVVCNTCDFHGDEGDLMSDCCPKCGHNDILINPDVKEELQTKPLTTIAMERFINNKN